MQFAAGCLALLAGLALYAQSGDPARGGRSAAPQPKLELKCGAQDNCAAYATTRAGVRVKAYQGYARAAGWRRHGGNLAELRWSCGSPCSISLFVDLDKGRVSEQMQDVLAVDAARALAAVGARRAIEVRRIFDGPKPLAKVERDFSPVAAMPSAIESAQFNAAGDLVLNYLKGAAFTPTRDVVHLDLKSPAAK